MMQSSQCQYAVDCARIQQMPLQGFSHRFTQGPFTSTAWAINRDHRGYSRHLILLSVECLLAAQANIDGHYTQLTQGSLPLSLVEIKLFVRLMLMMRGTTLQDVSWLAIRCT
jgi:hypothetical protein